MLRFWSVWIFYDAAINKKVFEIKETDRTDTKEFKREKVKYFSKWIQKYALVKIACSSLSIIEGLLAFSYKILNFFFSILYYRYEYFFLSNKNLWNIHIRYTSTCTSLHTHEGCSKIVYICQPKSILAVGFHKSIRGFGIFQLYECVHSHKLQKKNVKI